MRIVSGLRLAAERRGARWCGGSVAWGGAVLAFVDGSRPEELEGLLIRAKQRGVVLWLEGERLRYRAPLGVITDDLLGLLREHKASLVRHFERAGAPLSPNFERRPAPGEAVPVPRHLRWFWNTIKAGEMGIGYTNGCRAALRCEQPLDRVLLREAVGRLIDRHQILGARVTTLHDGRDGFICDVSPDAILSHVDMPLGDPADLERDLDAQITEFVWEPFDITRGLFRVRLIHRPDGASVLGIIAHHFIVDDLALTTAARELVGIYEALVAGRPPSHGLAPMQYTGYLLGVEAWLERPRAVELHRDYWQGRLRKASATHLRSAAPVDPEAFSEVIEHRFRIGEGAIGRLDLVCGRHGATLFMGLVAASHMVLRHLTGQSDLVLSFLADGRGPAIGEDVVGRFSNIVPLRVTVTPDTSFADLLDEIRDLYLASLPHWVCPFEALYDDIAAVCDGYDAPLISFRDVRALTPAPADGDTAEVLGEDAFAPPGGEPPTPRRVSAEAYKNFDVSLTRFHDGVQGKVHYPDLLHEPSTIARFSSLLAKSVESFARDPRATFASLAFGAVGGGRDADRRNISQ